MIDESAAPPSDIRGSGYGADHLWRNKGTTPYGPIAAMHRRTDYKCELCGKEFCHFYNSEPNIFRAMDKSDVSDLCPGKRRAEKAEAEQKGSTSHAAVKRFEADGVVVAFDREEGQQRWSLRIEKTTESGEHMGLAIRAAQQTCRLDWENLVQGRGELRSPDENLLLRIHGGKFLVRQSSSQGSVVEWSTAHAHIAPLLAQLMTAVDHAGLLFGRLPAYSGFWCVNPPDGDF